MLGERTGALIETRAGGGRPAKGAGCCPGNGHRSRFARKFRLSQRDLCGRVPRAGLGQDAGVGWPRPPWPGSRAPADLRGVLCLRRGPESHRGALIPGLPLPKDLLCLPRPPLSFSRGPFLATLVPQGCCQHHHEPGGLTQHRGVRARTPDVGTPGRPQGPLGFGGGIRSLPLPARGGRAIP